MLSVKSVYKKFKISNKKEIYADYDISFDAKDGEIIGVVGPNGAGKTTLLRMLGGILSPTEGEIIFDNMTYKKEEVQIKKEIGYLSGNTQIYNSFTPYELLKMCAELYDVPLEEREKTINSIIKKLNLESFLDKKIENLSTGQSQRVNIARLLVHDPKYYILDEVTNGLDVISSNILLNIVKEEKKKGKIIIYSTHHFEEIEGICDKILIINKGKVLYNDKVSKIFKDTKTSNLKDAFFTLIDEE